MEKRIFGKTGASISIIAMGGCGIGYVEQDIANKYMKLALDHGVNMIDVAPTYGNAEIRLNPFIKKYRNKFFIAGKTLKRSKNGALRQLNRSLEKLGTDFLDLYQFHAVSSMVELDQILGENGAMETFKQAKETDKIKHIGITCHSDVRVLLKAIELSDEIDTVLLPVYAGALSEPDLANDFRKVLKITEEKGLGVTAIKSISFRRWENSPDYTTWYEPIDNPELVDRLVWFTLSQEGVTTYSLPCDVKLWPLVLDAADRYKKLSEDEQLEIVEMVKNRGFKALFTENIDQI